MESAKSDLPTIVQASIDKEGKVTPEVVQVAAADRWCEVTLFGQNRERYRVGVRVVDFAECEVASAMYEAVAHPSDINDVAVEVTIGSTKIISETRRFESRLCLVLLDEVERAEFHDRCGHMAGTPEAAMIAQDILRRRTA